MKEPQLCFAAPDSQGTYTTQSILVGSHKKPAWTAHPTSESGAARPPLHYVRNCMDVLALYRCARNNFVCPRLDSGIATVRTWSGISTREV